MTTQDLSGGRGLGRSLTAQVCPPIFMIAACLLAPAVSSAAEPDLLDRTDIVLQDGFEDDQWFSQWGNAQAPNNTSVVRDGTAFRGDAHLRVQFPERSNYGTSFGLRFAAMGMEEPDEVYFRYAIRLGPTWSPTGGGKLPGFGGTYDVAGWGGRPSDGSNGWSARGLFGTPDPELQAGDTRVGYYTYHADMTGQYGSNWFWEGKTLSNGVMSRDRWYQIEVYVLNNTPGENDGVLRAWVDGAAVYEKNDVRFRDIVDLHVEKVWFDLYYGGNWTPPVDMYIDFDNPVIAWNYIGPVADEPPGGGDEEGTDTNTGGGPGDSGVGTDTGEGPGDSGVGTGTNGGTTPDPANPPGPDTSGVLPGQDDNEDHSASGCGCQTSRESPAAWSWLLLVAAGLTRRRRR